MQDDKDVAWDYHHSKVQSLWIGPIGTMERMCIRSYTGRGVEFHLYSYNPLLERERASLLYIHDANEILPANKIPLFPSPSIFSDFFRYALLMKKGGYYVDMDTICLQREFWSGLDYGFARDNIDQYYISGFAMKAPKKSEIMTHCHDWINGLTAEERAKLGHMDIGPYLVQKMVPQFKLETYVAPKDQMDPIPWDKITDIVNPEKAEDLMKACRKACMIHLRQSIWNEGPNSCAGILPDGTKISTEAKYPYDSLWEVLKRKYA
jgi:mannosyltransferase OCH1-like enzyme